MEGGKEKLATEHPDISEDDANGMILTLNEEHFARHIRDQGPDDHNQFQAAKSDSLHKARRSGDFQDWRSHSQSN
jgi:hypothetical protein